MEPASSSPTLAGEPAGLASRPSLRWPGRAWCAIKAGLREALLYAAGSAASKLRQYEALREMDPRMLRDMGLDIGDVLRCAPKSGKNDSAGR